MPIVTRWFIKTSLVFLCAALAVGIAQALWAPLPLGPVYIHLLVVGWITEIIFGVAYWMFPKYSKERPRGSSALAIASYLLLTSGLVLRVIFEPLHAWRPGAGVGGLLAVAAVLQWSGGMSFIVNTWPRVKERP